MILKVFYLMIFSASLAFEVAIYRSSDYLNNNNGGSNGLVPLLQVNETYNFIFKKDQRLNVDIRLKNKPIDIVASVTTKLFKSKLDKTPEIDVKIMTECKTGDCCKININTLKTQKITVGIEFKNKIDFNWSKYQIILQGTSGAEDHKNQVCLIYSIVEIDLSSLLQVLPLPTVANNDGKGSDRTTGISDASQQLAPPQDSTLIYIVSSVVVLGFVSLLAIYLIVKKIRRRNQAVTNTHSTTNEIMYADLSLTNGNNQPPTHEEESPYAQIIGVMRPKT